MKATKVNIRTAVQPYIERDAKGEFIPYEKAENMLDYIMENYVGVSSRYETRISGVEELIIGSATGRSEYFRIRIVR